MKMMEMCTLMVVVMQLYTLIVKKPEQALLRESLKIESGGC